MGQQNAMDLLDALSAPAELIGALEAGRDPIFLSAKNFGPVDWDLVFTRVMQSHIKAVKIAFPSFFDGEAVCQSLGELLQHESLEVLHLRMTPFGNRIAEFVRDNLRANSNLKELGLFFASVSETGAGHLAELLRSDQQLTALDLDGNPLGQEGSVSLLRALEHNSTLTQLWLPDTGVGTATIVQLAQTLRATKTLERLDIWSADRAELRAWGDFAQSLCQDCSLKHLGLALHHRAEGEQLAAALGAASSLTMLDLDLQFLSPEDRAHVVQQLSAALTSNQSLAGLKLGGDSSLACSSLVDEDVLIIANAMAGFQALSALDLSQNKLTSLAAGALATGLRVNTSLRTLDLSENGVTTAGAQELLASLRLNFTLTELHLTDNKCSEAVLQEIESWLLRNREPRIVLQVTATPSPRGFHLTFFKLSGPSPEGNDAVLELPLDCQVSHLKDRVKDEIDVPGRFAGRVEVVLPGGQRLYGLSDGSSLQDIFHFQVANDCTA